MTDPLVQKPRNENHLPWLDGLRGIAAFWVLAHHSFILVGGSGFPVLSWGTLAVDLFMILSGFLMAHHYTLRRSSHQWQDGGTWREFWLKRFFRIAPLYYLLLVIALSVGPTLGQFRDAIAQAWPATATAPDRYLDNSFSNFLIHISFIFGVIPEYSFRTALPDWSIGLEMQFYLVFPFLMLFLARAGSIRGGLVLCIACIVAAFIFRGFFRSFELPSFLPKKLYVFVIGIWMATGRTDGRMKNYLAASVFLCLIYVGWERSIEAVARIFVVVALFAMANPSRLTFGVGFAAIIERIKSVLSNKVAKFLGETSYGLYLVHLLIMIPIVGLLSGHSWFLGLPWPARMAMVVTLVAIPSYFCAWLLYKFVETWGITFGRRLLERRRIAAATAP